MAVKITDICIACGACIDECPVEAIVDDDDNPTGEDIYYVYADKCVECVGYHDEPACAAACPTEGCIVWSDLVDGQPSRDEIGADLRKGDTPCVE
ncbi:MAG: 4Fe-4S dicluster domain-containing protein [Sulfurospirillum sp.]